MANRKLTDIFVVPPISVLDIKQKYWKDRRKKWLALNIQSELGRNENLLKLSDLLQKKQKSTSIFDPVLCEIMYMWFSKIEDTIFDPFAGGSVRGIIASKMNRKYIGVDLRKEQVEHNYIQSNDICDSNLPKWLIGSSAETTIDCKYDLFFTCPPYYDLEKYSDDEKDLSNMKVEDFDREYESIISLSLQNLKNNRFAVIVVGVNSIPPNCVVFPTILTSPKTSNFVVATALGDVPMPTFPDTASLGVFNVVVAFVQVNPV
jgi:DNA modification methylase